MQYFRMKKNFISASRFLFVLGLAIFFSLGFTMCSGGGIDEEPEYVDKEDNQEPDDTDTDNSIVTKTDIEISSSCVMLYGEYKWTSTPEKVGFIISDTPEFKKKRILDIEPGSDASYSITVKGLLDQFKYYYRSFAVVDGDTKYGQVREFTTPELCYSINGTTYKMIKISGPYGDISMMQTELPMRSTTDFSLVGIDEDFQYMANLSSSCTKGITRELLVYLWKTTGLAWRVPTEEEWIYAASEAGASNGYTYSGSNDIDLVAWYSGNSYTRANQVAKKQPNALGFYDMSGNYAEFISNNIVPYIKDRDYETAKFFDALWYGGVAYGGDWKSAADQCTIFSNYSINTTSHQFDNSRIAFRLVYTREPLFCMSYAKGDANDSFPEKDNNDNNGGNSTNKSQYTSTYDNVDMTSLTVKLYGAVRNVTKEVEAGFELSDSEDFKESKMFSTKSGNGTYNMQLIGVIDNFKYFYRSYVKVNDKIEYGETKTFTLPQLTYTINGKTFKMIEVKNGPYGDFSMMQTELPLIYNTKFKVGDLDEFVITKSDDGYNKGWTRELLSKVIYVGRSTINKEEGVLWRFPTEAEWKMAAKGNSNYVYSGSDDIADVAWFNGNSTKAHEVALKKANDFGFYDMNGNYSELVSDGAVPDIIDDINRWTTSYFDGQWLYPYACGGNWSSDASACTTESKYFVSSMPNTNAFDNKTIAFRLMYQRRPLTYLSVY